MRRAGETAPGVFAPPQARDLTRGCSGAAAALVGEPSGSAVTFDTRIDEAALLADAALLTALP